MLETVDKRIAAIVTKRSGNRLEEVLAKAQQLVTSTGKQPERALADALVEVLRNKEAFAQDRRGKEVL